MVSKAEKERRERGHMDNLDGVGRQYRQRAGLPERTTDKPFDETGEDVPETHRPSGPEDGYGGEELQPEPEEREEATSPGTRGEAHPVAPPQVDHVVENHAGDEPKDED